MAGKWQFVKDSETDADIGGRRGSARVILAGRQHCDLQWGREATCNIACLMYVSAQSICAGCRINAPSTADF